MADAYPDDDPPHPATLTLRQQERRERLLDAALSLVTAQGYERVQVKEVADLAEVSLGTLYNYFTSKERLFAEVLVRWTESLATDVRNRSLPQGPPPARLSEAMRRAVHAFELRPQMARLITILAISSDPVSSRLVEQMERSTTDAYMLALADLDPILARRVVDVVNAIFTTTLLGWSNERITTREFYNRVFSAVELLTPSLVSQS
jgi:TetR/AcrR family transcriptional regulator, cholesterol catabolism regulator